MGYWIVALGLIAFGIAGLMSIGPPILQLGVVLLVLGPLRRYPRLFAPLASAAVAFTIAFFLVAPMYCSASSSPAPAVPSGTTCASLTGVPWPSIASGLADRDAAIGRTNEIGLVVAACTAGLVVAVQSLQRRRREGNTAS